MNFEKKKNQTSWLSKINYIFPKKIYTVKNLVYICIYICCISSTYFWDMITSMFKIFLKFVFEAKFIFSFFLSFTHANTHFSFKNTWKKSLTIQLKKLALSCEYRLYIYIIYSMVKYFHFRIFHVLKKY